MSDSLTFEEAYALMHARSVFVGPLTARDQRLYDDAKAVLRRFRTTFPETGRLHAALDAAWEGRPR